MYETAYIATYVTRCNPAVNKYAQTARLAGWRAVAQMLRIEKRTGEVPGLYQPTWSFLK